MNDFVYVIVDSNRIISMNVVNLCVFRKKQEADKELAEGSYASIETNYKVKKALLTSLILKSDTTTYHAVMNNDRISEDETSFLQVFYEKEDAEEDAETDRTMSKENTYVREVAIRF